MRPSLNTLSITVGTIIAAAILERVAPAVAAGLVAAAFRLDAQSAGEEVKRQGGR